MHQIEVDEPLSFYRHRLLDILRKKIPQFPLDWQSVANQFRKTELAQERNYEAPLLTSRLCEIALRQALKRFEVDSLGRVKCDPIPPRAESKHYLFTSRDGEIDITRKGERQPFTGIDALITIEDRPVVFECKSLGYNQRSKLAAEVLIPQRTRKKVIPIVEYFDMNPQECGYVLAVFPEVAGWSKFEPFTNRGGVIMPLWMGRDATREAVFNIARIYNLWNKRLDTDPYFETCREKEKRALGLS